MSNMSYCRFRNTLADLLDCEEALNTVDWDDISPEEKEAVLGIAEVCERMVEDFNFDGLEV